MRVRVGIRGEHSHTRIEKSCDIADMEERKDVD